MNLEEKLRQLRRAAQKTVAEGDLERQLDWLRRRQTSARPLPSERVSRGIEHYVEGCLQTNHLGEYFLARQALPFGRPYGKLRVGDVSTADLGALEVFLEGAALPDPAELIYLDTETTGLAGGTGTCAFLIGLGMIEGSAFVVHQFFLRDYPDEKAMLAALGEMLAGFEGLVTFNGKTFDLPLLETRYALARQKPPFGRLVHVDLLHPARRLWKLRLERCHLTHLEKEVLGIGRKGDVDGADIPGIYFDYLRTGDARGLQPVFYHNALDIVTLAALTAEMARLIRVEAEASDAALHATDMHSLDLFSLSRIFEGAGDADRAFSACRRALASGLPEPVESRALWHLAAAHRRRGEYEQSAKIWTQITDRQGDYFLEALEQLAIHSEHRQRDFHAALEFTNSALEWLTGGTPQSRDEGIPWRTRSPLRFQIERFTHRLERLRRKAARTTAPPDLVP